MTRSMLAILLALFAIFAIIPVQASRTSPSSGSALDCPLPPGWSAVAQQQARLVIFGELHGTEQAPRFVGQVACALALSGKRVLVAAEHGVHLAPVWQAAWDLPPGRFEAALAAQGWAGRNDGVGSKAYFDMLVRLHLLKARGHSVAITPYTGFVDKAQFERLSGIPGQGGYEAAMAENIATAAKAGDYDVVLVLVGNLHARKTPVVRGEVSFEPMAMQLARQAKVVTLDMRHGPGTSWICQLKPGVAPGPGKRIGPDDMACGNLPTAGYPGFRGAPRITLESGGTAEAPAPYDGVFWLGPVTGSAPILR